MVQWTRYTTTIVCGTRRTFRQDYISLNLRYILIFHSCTLGASSIIYIDPANFTKSDERFKFSVLIENVNEFYIKKDFMFATRKVLVLVQSCSRNNSLIFFLKDRNTIELWVSYKRNSFVKANFQTELDIKGLHICDVEGKNLMVSAAHTTTMAHLYVAEFDEELKTITFVKSLENIFTFIPNVIWKHGWIMYVLFISY